MPFFYSTMDYIINKWGNTALRVRRGQQLETTGYAGVTCSFASEAAKAAYAKWTDHHHIVHSVASLLHPINVGNIQSVLLRC
jgi:hypothetical protein